MNVFLLALHSLSLSHASRESARTVNGDDDDGGTRGFRERRERSDRDQRCTSTERAAALASAAASMAEKMCFQLGVCERAGEGTNTLIRAVMVLVTGNHAAARYLWWNAAKASLDSMAD